MSADVGPYAEMAPGRPGTMATSAPPPDRLVWRVTLGEIAGPTGARVAIILIDFWNSQLILWTEAIS